MAFSALTRTGQKHSTFGSGEESRERMGLSCGRCMDSVGAFAPQFLLDGVGVMMLSFEKRALIDHCPSPTPVLSMRIVSQVIAKFFLLLYLNYFN
jgi:hypothetical protein